MTKPYAQTFVAAIRNSIYTVDHISALTRAQQIDPQVRVVKPNQVTAYLFSDGSEARTQPRPKTGGLYAYAVGRRRNPGSLRDPNPGAQP